jgi:AraC-like DNA-binding protein
MSGFQTSLYLVAVALCIFCTGITVRSRGREFSWFTGFLVIQSAAFLCELLMAHPSTPLKALWLAMLMSGSLLLAPCLWLAFQESIGGARPRLRDLPRAHFLVIGAGFLLTLPLIWSAHLGTTYWNPLRVTPWWQSKLIHTTMLMCIGIFVVQVPWYLLRCRRILVAKLAGQKSHWCELPLAIVLTTWALAILRTLDCAFIKWPPTFSLVVAVVSVGVTVGALYLLLRKFLPSEGQPEPGAPEKPAAYAKSPLGDGLRSRIRRKLDASLNQDAIYKRSDLTLRTLSEILNESPHYLSQVISQDLQTSFYELVNGYRIDAAKRLLREAEDETVLAIAMSVGFNSKSAFHSAFRRRTGTTPTEFRQSAVH